MQDPLRTAKALALLVPAVLLAGAYGSQHIGGLAPCEVCYWQRYAHFAGLAFAILALLAGRMPDRGRSFVWLAALGILVSGAIGVFHAGMELDWWEGFTQCAAPAGGGDDFFKSIMEAPLVRCDEVQWADPVLGISMAGWNAILSISAACAILWLSLKRPRPA